MSIEPQTYDQAMHAIRGLEQHISELEAYALTRTDEINASVKQCYELAAQNEAMRALLPHTHVSGYALEQQYLSALASINLPAEILRKRDEAKDARIAELEAEAFNFRISIGFLTDKGQQLAAQNEAMCASLKLAREAASPFAVHTWYADASINPDMAKEILRQRDIELLQSVLTNIPFAEGRSWGMLRKKIQELEAGNG